MLPSVCRFAKAGDDPCGIGVDHYRDRKTGPTVGIAALELRQASRDYLAARGPLARAGVVVAVLSRLPPDRRLLDCLIGSGALTGTWGGAQRWDPGQGGPRRRLFPGRGIPDG